MMSSESSELQKSFKPSDTQKRGIPVLIFGGLGFLYFAFLAVIIAYTWLVAQDRFLSVATFKISRSSSPGSELGFAGIALPGLADTGSQDSQVAIGFVNSTDLLLDLETRFKLRDHYAAPPRDFVFRLAADAPLEDRLEYYRKRIFSHYDKETGLIYLTADTFDPGLSKRIAETVLIRTEVFINGLNQTVADQQLAFIRNEVERAEKHVSDVSLELLNLQNETKIVSPDDIISASLQTVQKLKMERISMDGLLATLERDSPESPRINSLRSELRSLNEQIAIESITISGPEQDRLNQVLARYKELELKLDFAVNLRTGAETLLEKHRVDAVARSRFLSVIQLPFLPEKAGYPQRGYATATFLILGILLFLILRVLVHSIYERVN